MVSIASVVGQIKLDVGRAISVTEIEVACRELQCSWRQRELDPATTVALFLQQVLHGNCACAEVRRLPAAAGLKFTASAYCQARQRLPLKLLQTLATRVAAAAAVDAGAAGHCWRGHRLWHVDGSSFGMPDSDELRKHFGLPNGVKTGCGFPSAHLLVLFSATTGMLLNAIASPLNTADLRNTPTLYEHLKSGDLVIGDSHFGAYGHLALLQGRNCHGLFAVPWNRIVDFTPGRPHAESSDDVGLPRSRWVATLGEQDQLVEWLKPSLCPPWLTPEQWKAMPEKLLVREIRRTVRGEKTGTVVLTMVTTLIDPVAYPAEELLKLRLRRWDVETDIGSLKTAMGMDVLRCKTVDGVKKELATFTLAYNLVRVVILEAARRQEVPVRRISFTDALRWMRHARSGDELPHLMLVPDRPDRAEPRVRKRRPKVYDHMTKPRAILRKALKKRVRNA